MENKFIYSRGYTDKDGLVSAEHSKIEAFKEYDILLHKRGGENHSQEVIECTVNMFVELAIGLSNSKKDYNSPLNTNGINLQLVHALKALSNFAGYLINSTSWQDQEVKDFDVIELQRRLDILKSNIR